MPDHRIPAENREFARQLRRGQTEIEDLLWRELRGRRLAPWKFRRQVPVEGFVVDFFCPAARLIVEADGPHHLDGEQAARDRARDGLLQAKDFRVLRFSGDRIQSDLAGVLAEIGNTLASQQT